jgi:hypothetical protein
MRFVVAWAFAASEDEVAPQNDTPGDHRGSRARQLAWGCVVWYLRS